MRAREGDRGGAARRPRPAAGLHPFESFHSHPLSQPPSLTATLTAATEQAHAPLCSPSQSLLAIFLRRSTARRGMSSRRRAPSTSPTRANRLRRTWTSATMSRRPAARSKRRRGGATARCPGRLGRRAPGLGCSTHSGGVPQPPRPQWQRAVLPLARAEVVQFCAFRAPGLGCSCCTVLPLTPSSTVTLQAHCPRSRQPMRPPTAPQAHPLARGCPLCPRRWPLAAGTPTRGGLRSGACPKLPIPPRLSV